MIRRQTEKSNKKWEKVICRFLSPSCFAEVAFLWFSVDYLHMCDEFHAHTKKLFWMADPKWKKVDHGVVYDELSLLFLLRKVKQLGREYEHCVIYLGMSVVRMIKEKGSLKLWLTDSSMWLTLSPRTIVADRFGHRRSSYRKTCIKSSPFLHSHVSDYFCGLVKFLWILVDGDVNDYLPKHIGMLMSLFFWQKNDAAS